MATTTTTTAATIVLSAASSLAITNADAAGHSMDASARAAAKLIAADKPAGTLPADFYRAVRPVINAKMTHKSACDSLTAALALLLYGRPFDIAADSRTESKKSETFKGAEVLLAGEPASNAEKSRTVGITPERIVDRFPADLMKRCANKARDELGLSKPGNKGGRPATPAAGTRASFADELAALCSTPDGMMSLQTMLKKSGYRLEVIPEPKSAKK